MGRELHFKDVNPNWVLDINIFLTEVGSTQQGLHIRANDAGVVVLNDIAFGEYDVEIKGSSDLPTWVDIFHKFVIKKTPTGLEIISQQITDNSTCCVTRPLFSGKNLANLPQLKVITTKDKNFEWYWNPYWNSEEEAKCNYMLAFLSEGQSLDSFDKEGIGLLHAAISRLSVGKQMHNLADVLSRNASLSSQNSNYRDSNCHYTDDEKKNLVEHLYLALAYANSRRMDKLFGTFGLMSRILNRRVEMRKALDANVPLEKMQSLSTMQQQDIKKARKKYVMHSMLSLMMKMCTSHTKVLK